MLLQSIDFNPIHSFIEKPDVLVKAIGIEQAENDEDLVDYVKDLTQKLKDSEGKLKDSEVDGLQIDEACLSVPDYWMAFDRFNKIKVKYFTEKGEENIKVKEAQI